MIGLGELDVGRVNSDLSFRWGCMVRFILFFNNTIIILK